MEKERSYLLTMKEINRLEIIRKCINKEIRVTEASLLLGLSYRHTLRLVKAVKTQGVEGILLKKKGRAKKITKETEQQIVHLYKNIYESRLNILHFKDILEEFHNISYSYETIRSLLISNNCHTPKKKKRSFRKKRKRMSAKGMLIQMDSSEHYWLPHINKKYQLIAMIDDASKQVHAAKFFEKDTTFNNMEVIRMWIEKQGLFKALYTDKASHFISTRHGGTHYTTSEDTNKTNIEKALDELGITLITANSPQAKGRVERLFGVMQDRLLNELFINKIKDYDEANTYLQKVFLPKYNKKFTIDVKEDIHMPLNKNINLDMIFTKRFQRTVRKDNTISINGEIIQLFVGLGASRAKVEVRIDKNNKIWVLHKGMVVHTEQLDENNKINKKEVKIDNIINQRYYSHVT